MMDNAPKRSTPGSIPGQGLGRTSVIFEVFLTDEIRSRISFMPEHTCPRRGVKSQMCLSTFKPKDSAAAMNDSHYAAQFNSCKRLLLLRRCFWMGPLRDKPGRLLG